MTERATIPRGENDCRPFAALMPCGRCGAHRWAWRQNPPEGVVQCGECAAEYHPEDLYYPVTGAD